jgi:hypothetical protein
MPQDAAYLVEAAVVAQSLPRLERRSDGAILAKSGMVYVHGVDIQRLRDGLKWTDGRNLGNGVNVYREKASDLFLRDALTKEDIVSIFLCPSVFPSHISRLALSQL